MPSLRMTKAASRVLQSRVQNPTASQLSRNRFPAVRHLLTIFKAAGRGVERAQPLVCHCLAKSLAQAHISVLGIKALVKT